MMRYRLSLVPRHSFHVQIVSCRAMEKNLGEEGLGTRLTSHQKNKHLAMEKNLGEEGLGTRLI